jgi:crotonobetainyl-CoA:carnitine CoA-transferase CaiB-like acyl-CoA transferase
MTLQQQMWHPLLRTIGREDVAGDLRYETAEARWQHKAEVDALVEIWTAKRGKHGVMKVLAGAGVPCGACLDTGEVLTDPASRLDPRPRPSGPLARVRAPPTVCGPGFSAAHVRRPLADRKPADH